MKNIVIFSGTTEGRTLSESFAAAGIPVVVCVATGYGEEVMKPDPLINVHTGRMDEGGMERFFAENNTDLVFDATHPYATEASQNIRKACEARDIRYQRIERKRSAAARNGDGVVRTVSSTAESLSTIKTLKGNILLTTGVKELADFTDISTRLYVRVLPSVEAIKICDECGIAKSHIIAQQGPFTYEENLALMKRYDIAVLVTKNSGKMGGYDEKIRAARAAGVSVITIEKNDSIPICHENKISVIGAGCGEKTLTVAAAELIRDAELIIGSSRLLDYDIVKKNPCPKYNAYVASEIVDIIKKEDKDRICVLFSGDTGFYSGAAKLCEALKKDKYMVDVIPGISSLSMMASILHESYETAAVRSFHGRYMDPAEVIRVVSENERSFFLLSGKNDLSELYNILNQSDTDYVLCVGCDFNGDSDRISILGREDSISDIPDGRLYIAECIREDFR